MIAILPRLLPPPNKGAADSKSPTLPTQSATTPSGQAASDAAPSEFAAWIAKALAGLPIGDAQGKSAKDKTETKATDKADKAAQDAVASMMGADQQALLPQTQLAKAASSAGSQRQNTSEKHEAAAIGTAERRSQTSLAATDAKNAAAKQVTVKPPLPELAPKTLAEATTKTAGKSDGMTVAQSEERMNTAAEQNNIAGQATQKLPSAAQVTSAAAIKADGAAGKVRLPVDFSQRDGAMEQIALTTAKAASAPVAATAVAAAHAVSSLDRVEQMVAREAITFKHSGANEVGVSLKVDAQTQLFLQLSYRDGQTQAFLRCEKGDLPGLSAHFGQLQESLARQNIQLQSSNGGFDLGRQGSSDRSRQELAQTEEPVLKDATKSTTTTKTKTTSTSQRGWESWA